MEQELNVGDVAPEFVLKNQHGAEVRLSDFEGQKNVVLSFHPLAWTSVCAEQMKALEAHKADFDGFDAVALGFSVDSVPSKRAWAEALGIEHTALVADFWPHGGVAQAYDVFLPEGGTSTRVVFIVDKEGQIAFKKVYPMSQVPDMDEILAALKDCSAVFSR
jgi:peroxiredoxin